MVITIDKRGHGFNGWQSTLNCFSPIYVGKKKRIRLNKSYLGVKGIKRNKQNYVLVKRCSGYWFRNSIIIASAPLFPQCFPHTNNKKRQTVLHTFNGIFPIFKVSYQTQTSLRNVVDDVARAALCTHTGYYVSGTAQNRSRLTSTVVTSYIHTQPTLKKLVE